MTMQHEQSESGMRPVIMKAAVVCLAIAIAPWLSGGQEALGMVISGFALLLGALLVWRQPQMRKLKLGPLVVGYGLLIGFAVLSLVWTANRYSTGVWIIQWVLAGLTFRLAYAISHEKVGRKWLVGAYLLSAAVFSLVAIYMYLTSEYGRLTGTFYWANPAAAYLIPAILMVLEGLRRSSGRTTYGWAGLTALCGSAFLLTDSRAALAVLAVVVALYLLISRLNRRFWILFVFSGALAFSASYGLVRLSATTVQHSNKIVPGSRLNEAVKGESSSGSDRLYYVQSALQMWWARPVGGVGAGAYRDVHPQYQLRVVSASTNAHNVYIQVLAELGLVGASLLGLLMLTLTFGTLRGLFVHPGLVPVALGTLGLLMHFALDIDASYPALLGLVGAFFGLMYAQNAARGVKLRFVWPLLSVMVLAPIISLYLSETWATRAASIQGDGDYRLAAEDFGRASQGLLYNPDHITAQGINLYTLASFGAPDAAIRSTEALTLSHRAQKRDPYDAQHYQLEGRILALRGDNSASAAAYRKALALDRFNHPDYALDFASVLLRQGLPEQAAGTANDMLAQYPAPVRANRVADETLMPMLANLEAFVGNVYLSQGRISEAGAAADRALALDPKGLRGRALQHQVNLVKSLKEIP